MEPFVNSAAYWERRYESGGNSGAGSYGHLADFKAQVINEFVKEHSVKTVIEHGCGDGNQVKLANYESYIGVDVSAAVISICKEFFKSDNSKKS